MDELLIAIIRIFAALLNADDRPKSRQFVLGCAGILAVLGLIVWLVWRSH